MPSSRHVHQQENLNAIYDEENILLNEKTLQIIVGPNSIINTVIDVLYIRYFPLMSNALPIFQKF